MKWAEIPLPAALANAYAAQGTKPGQAWRCDDGRLVMFGVEYGRWHLSISRPDRLPSWEDICDARDMFLPKDVWLCQPMPPRRYWLNIHNFCLHLWETRDAELIAQWKADGEAVRR